jgi:hypothetical protein
MRKRIALTLAAAVVLVGLVAAAASGTIYETKRPGLTVEVRATQDRIKKLHLFFRVHCDDGTTRREETEVGEFRHQAGGRFTWETPDFASILDEAGHGTVHEGVVTGKFHYRLHRIVQGRNVQNCWSGHKDQAGVRFVARRQ